MRRDPVDRFAHHRGALQVRLVGIEKLFEIAALGASGLAVLLQRRRGGVAEVTKAAAQAGVFAIAEMVNERGHAALAAIDRLHRRYATYSAYPGRPLRFVENLLRDGGLPGAAFTTINPGEEEAPKPIDEEEVYLAFTRETGLPRSIIDPAVPLDVDETSRWFSSRIAGQPDAVNLVVDLLATVKAGLMRPNRPIGCSSAPRKATRTP